MTAAPSLCSIVEVVKGSSDAPIPDYVESIYWWHVNGILYGLFTQVVIMVVDDDQMKHIDVSVGLVRVRSSFTSSRSYSIEKLSDHISCHTIAKKKHNPLSFSLACIYNPCIWWWFNLSRCDGWPVQADQAQVHDWWSGEENVKGAGNIGKQSGMCFKWFLIPMNVTPGRTKHPVA